MLLLQAMPQPDATATSLLWFGCAAFAVLLYVYIFTPSTPESGEEKTRLGYLYERKEQIYENLRDLNFEYKAGKLGENDFTSMRESMEQEAAGVLAEIDQLEKSQPAAGRG